jgi:hypothetical protein
MLFIFMLFVSRRSSATNSSLQIVVVCLSIILDSSMTPHAAEGRETSRTMVRLAAVRLMQTMLWFASGKCYSKLMWEQTVLVRGE